MDILDWLRAVVALAVTLGLIGLAAVTLRRLGMLEGGFPGMPQQRRLRVVERLMLDPRRSVVIVRVDAEEHVLLLSPFGERKLARQAAPPDPPPPETSTVAPAEIPAVITEGGDQ
jgi:flagellar protein FliO/FliZ